MIDRGNSCSSPFRARPRKVPAPVSALTTPPDPLTAALDAVLHSERCYESTEGMRLRRTVLNKLNILVEQWIQSVSLSRGMSWNDLDLLGGRIVTYGSYMLGISHQGSDIDALCIAPQHITRQEYFTSFYTLLSYQPEVTDLRAIEEAFVPVLKMRYNGIEIDMTFTRLLLTQVPLKKKKLPGQDGDDDDDDAADVEELSFLNSKDFPVTKLEDKCLRSLNGYRATVELYKIVPDRPVFRITLRAIKLWAKGQGLYSNILGFLGGFSWAILVAKVCKDNPGATPAQMVHKFFGTFGNWQWPRPVLLQDDDKHYPCGYKDEVMPIVTPISVINSSFNVTESYCKLITNKMKEASRICEQIFKNEETWETLFRTRHVLHEYDHFLVVYASAVNHIQWFGLIESKIRHFLTGIEKAGNVIVLARIWPKPYPNSIGGDKSQQMWFVGLELAPGATAKDIDINRPLKHFQESLKAQSKSYHTNDMRIDAHYVGRTDVLKKLNEREIEEIIMSQSHKRVRISPQIVEALQTPPTAQTKANKRGSRNDEQKLNSSYASALSRSGQYSSSPPTNSVPKMPVPNIPPMMLRVPPPMMYQHSHSKHRHGSTFYTSPSAPLLNGSYFHCPVPPPNMQQHYAGSSPSMRTSPSPVAQRVWKSPKSKSKKESNLRSTPIPSDSSDKWSSVSSLNGQLDIQDATAIDTDLLSPAVSSTDLDSHGRSVSCSSDHFPPQALVQARLQHNEKAIPYSPATNTTFFNKSSMSPIETKKSHLNRSTSNGSNKNTNNNILTTDGKANKRTTEKKNKENCGQRFSSSEICDVMTPMPIQRQNYPAVHFNFNPASIQQFQQAAAAAAADSVFQ